MIQDKVRIGARGSALSLKQAMIAAASMREIGFETEIVPVNSKGDIDRSSPLYKMDSQGVFVDSINRLLVSGEIDIAVHSAKDIPSAIQEGLVVSAVLKRSSPEDCIVSRPGTGIMGLPRGAVVGTSSLRRKYDALEVRPDLKVRDIRGNVDTRIRKMLENEFDAVILAEAGIQRLGLDIPHATLPVRQFIPSPNQGIIALMTSSGSPFSGVSRKIDHPETRVAYNYERIASETLLVGCSHPAGILCVPGDPSSTLMVRIRSDDGSRKVELVEEFSSMGEFEAILEGLSKSVGELR